MRLLYEYMYGFAWMTGLFLGALIRLPYALLVKGKKAKIISGSYQVEEWDDRS